MAHTFSEILDDLRTCPPQERRPKIQALMASADDPLPVKKLSAVEKSLVAELRVEINQLAAQDAYANEATINANIAAIRRIEGR
jgi:hypothetical protein